MDKEKNKKKRDLSQVHFPVALPKMVPIYLGSDKWSVIVKELRYDRLRKE